MVQSNRRTSFLGALALLAGLVGFGLTWFGPAAGLNVPLWPAHHPSDQPAVAAAKEDPQRSGKPIDPDRAEVEQPSATPQQGDVKPEHRASLQAEIAEKLTRDKQALTLGRAISGGALVLSLIALLTAATSPKIKTGLPVLAVLVCGATTLAAFRPDLLSRLPLPTTNKPPVPASVPPVTAARQPAEAPAPAEDVPTRRAKTIFDTDYPSSTPPPPVVKKDLAAPLPEIHDAPAIPVAPPVKVDNAAAVRAAKNRLDSARSAVVRSLESSPAYQSAKADADQAEADLKKARLTNEPGSADLIAASKNSLDARGRLQKLVNDAMAKDPASQDASRELQALQSGR